MLDIKQIRKEPEKIRELLSRRGEEAKIDALLAMDVERREILSQTEQIKAEQNKVSKQIPAYKKEGKDTAEIFGRMKSLAEEGKELDRRLRELDESIKESLLNIPNTPNEHIAIGKDENDNVEIRKHLQPRIFDFAPKAHWDLGVELDILDFERAVKITGSRFSMFKGLGAKLARALIQFMLDTNATEGGYTEISPPFMVNRKAMTGTGQLPKFEFDIFGLRDTEYFLVPTAEVPLTNIYADEILPEEMLPVYFTAYTPCFRAEAGSAGRDTRGLIRNHQFDKVELVKLVKPEHSYDELESLTADAEKILQKLQLPYRVIELCTGDIGFSSAKTYDIEVFMPSYGRYVEISSCSNFEAFQARRANLRYRGADGKVNFLHTLNGSSLAVGRAFAAIVENYQQADGSVRIPDVLISYMNGITVIEKEGKS
ncbi:MAG: serine--tRNA ligase [Eubacteriaceae bacterium]|jgi:seryl-tRNA synthetase|nr:serine--tRNA ligase [Eubacteriaceae bacterium]